MNDSMRDDKRLGQLLAEEYEEIQMDVTFKQGILMQTRSAVTTRNGARDRWKLFALTATAAAVLVVMMLRMNWTASQKMPQPVKPANQAIVPPKDNCHVNSVPKKSPTVIPNHVLIAYSKTKGDKKCSGLSAVKESKDTHITALHSGTAVNLAVIAIQSPVKDAEGRNLKLGDRILNPDTVKTGAGGRVSLISRNGSQFHLDSNTSLSVMAGGKVKIARGRVYCSNRLEEIKQIDTPSGRIQLLGTVLDTAVLSSGKTAVTVVQGKVRLSNAHGMATIAAGRRSVMMASYSPEEGTPVNTALVTAWYDGRGKVVSDFGEISYTVYRPDSHIMEIWAMNSDGSGKHRMKSFIGGAYQGDWLPAAQWLTVNNFGLVWAAPDFTKHTAIGNAGHPITGMGSHLYMLNAANCADLPIALPTGFLSARMAPSPNGRYIAFTGLNHPSQDGPSQHGLWIFDMETGAMKRLIEGDLQTMPAWSPNSRYVVVSSGSFHGTGQPHSDYTLVMVDVGTGEITKSNVQGAGAAVSPDGKLVAFCGDFKCIEDTYNQIPLTGSILVQQAGAPSSARRITPEGESAVEPSWSPDGSRILYRTYLKPEKGSAAVWGTEHVYVVQADGTARKEIYCSRGDGATPAWSGDGRTVYIRKMHDLIQVAADGSGVITDLGGNAEDSRLSPDEELQTSQASAAIEEAVYQFALGNVRAFEGKPAESRAAFKVSAETFASLPWKYPLANLSVNNCVLYADSASALATKADEAVLADSCMQRMRGIAGGLRFYNQDTKAFPPDSKTLEDWLVNNSRQLDDWMTGNKRPEWTKMMFSCPGSENSGPVPFVYRKSAAVGEVILTCPNHPQNSIKLDEWMIRR